MPGNQRVHSSLMWAVQEGRLEKVRELINSFGLSYSRACSEGYVLLRHAVQNRHAAVAKLLLKSGSKVNSKSKNPSDTPLHFAVTNVDIDVVEMLLDRGANIDAKNKCGKTPLHIAIERKKVEVTELLLRCRAHVNARDNGGRSPLHVAVDKGFLQIVEHLLKYGAEVNVTDNEGASPLHVAAERGFLQIVECLLKYGAGVNYCVYTSTWKKGYTPLHLAVENDDRIAELLLSRGANVDVNGEDGITPLHIAVKEGSINVADDLLNRGACLHSSTLEEGYTALHFASALGNEEATKLLLDRGANVDVKGEDGITPLHLAVKKRHIHIAKDLLVHGACLDASTLKEGYTALHFASALGNEEIAQLLLNRGANVDVKGEDGMTPLHIATKREQESVVRLLLQHGAEVDNQDKDGKTILRLAVEKGHLMIVDAVLKCCPDINNQSNRSSLKTAVLSYEEEYKKIVEALLGYGLNVNPEDANDPVLLHTAIEKGYLKIVEGLLKYGADVDVLHNVTYGKNVTPLHSAAIFNQEEVAKLLISYGAYVNARDKTGKTPIFHSIENTNLKITKLLLTYRANVKDNPELLNMAVKKDSIEIIEAIVQHGADINASDEYGRTALHFIASGESRFFTDEDPNISIKGEIAKLLLSKGANVDAQTAYGETTLHAAAQKGYVKVVEALLKNSANVCAKRKDGNTALHIAAHFGHREVVKVLLKCGAKVDSRTKSHVTPLHLGAQKGCQKIVETILKFGADINSRDECGRTALHIASENEHNEVVATLLEYGSDINIMDVHNRTPLNRAMDMTLSFYRERDIYYSDDDCDEYDSDRGVCSYEVIAEALKRHIVKMNTANLYVSERNLLYVRSSEKMREFEDECGEEIARMKSEMINNTNISFHDILAKGTRSLVMYMRNENIVQVSKSDDYKTKFPIYATMIKHNFRKGMERRELLEQANKSFHFVFNNFPELPDDCTEEIFSYLSDQHLRILMDACKPLSISSLNTYSYL